jgi:hypothetical protein
MKTDQATPWRLAQNRSYMRQIGQQFHSASICLMAS